MLVFDLQQGQQATRQQAGGGHYDLSLVMAATALAALGVVMVASSSIAISEGQHLGPFHYLDRHLVFLALGIVLAVAAARTELSFLERHAGLLLLGGLNSIPGAMAGGLIIGLVEALGSYFQPGLKEIIPWIVMLIILLIRPYGLFGERRIERI